MTHFLPIAMLLTLLVLPEQDLPAAFYELPEQVREQATLIVTGTYSEGRGPCIFMADGTRRWALTSMIRITKVHRGKAGGKVIYISRTSLLDPKTGSMKLTREQTYLVLLRPSEKSMKAIKEGGHVPTWDSLRDEEIVAVVELK